MVKEAKPFAVGEQIVFLRNDYSLGVRNGQLGVIQKIDEGFLHVEMEFLKTITFDISQYRFFDQGYATTIHKSQASTVDQTFLYASQGMDQPLTYVGLTRHRHQAHVYADKTDFSNLEQLYSCLSRENPKENIFDDFLESRPLASSPLAATQHKREPALPLIETFLAIRERLQAYPNPLHRTAEQKQEIQALLEHSRQVSYQIKQDPELMRRIQELGFEQNVKTQASNDQDSPHAYTQTKSYTKGRNIKI